MRTAQEYNDLFRGLWATLGDPPLTGREAAAAVRRLTRHVLGVSEFGEVKISTRLSCNTYGYGAKYTDTGAGGWRIAINPKFGWEEMIDTLAIYLEGAYTRETRSTLAGIERMKVRLTHEVIKRGWIAGTLAPPPKEPPSKEVKIRARIKRIEVLKKQWERKSKRAANAFNKLEKERIRLERRLHA
jgi:hypothetical protein